MPTELPLRGVPVVRLSGSGTPPVRGREDVVMEGIVTLEVEGMGQYTLTCTPEGVEDLAVGFALSEGMIDGRGDILKLERGRGDASVLEMRVSDPTRIAPGRNLLVTSSCGVCGVRNLEPFLAGMVKCDRTLMVTRNTILGVSQAMRERQRLFTRTGGSHAAALFGPDGAILAFAEDIGRHNALDKVVGMTVRSGRSPRGLAVMFSGRVSWEIAAKAARAGIEVVAAVSAPSSLAVSVADGCGLTLCGFVREDRLTVYAHPDRIAELAGVELED